MNILSENIVTFVNSFVKRLRNEGTNLRNTVNFYDEFFTIDVHKSFTKIDKTFSYSKVYSYDKINAYAIDNIENIVGEEIKILRKKYWEFFDQEFN